MAINVLQYNQLIRKVNVKNEQIEAQRRLRDSADSACGQIPDQIDPSRGSELHSPSAQRTASANLQISAGPRSRLLASR